MLRPVADLDLNLDYISCGTLLVWSSEGWILLEALALFWAKMTWKLAHFIYNRTY